MNVTSSGAGREGLRLPASAGGQLCSALEGAELYRRLVTLGVSGIAATDGHQSLCDAYGRFLQAKAAAAAAEYLGS